MKILSEEIIKFFKNQSFVIVSTIDGGGNIHNACKGLITVNEKGRVYLLDLYLHRTYENLKRNNIISVTAIDEHRFKGYCLKGKARMFSCDKLDSPILKAWENKIASRITQRLLRNIRGEKARARHPEALLPAPKYIIVMKVDEIVDLTPHHLREVLYG